jgi:hypothetical protein
MEWPQIIVPVRASSVFRGWMGVKMRDASLVKGVGVLPMFTGLIGLLLLGAFAAIWLRERVDRTRTAYRCVNHTDRPDFAVAN